MPGRSKLFLAAYLILALGVLSLAGCSDSPANSPTPVATNAIGNGVAQGTPTNIFALATPGASTPSPASTQPAAEATQGGNMRIRVTSVEVWQDFMPGIREGGPPLHATIAVEFSSLPSIASTGRAGSVTFRRASGEEIATGDLELMGREDDLGLQILGPQVKTFRMSPQPVALTLTEGEMVGGTVRLLVGGQEMTAPLPETPLTFTH